MDCCYDNKNVTLPKIRPTKTSMTFWSKNDPVRNFSGTVDHWTKLRTRAREQAGLNPNGSAKSFDCYLYNSFNSKPPGEYHLHQPKTINGKTTFLRNSYYRKAKEGHKYWVDYKTYPIVKSAFAPRYFEKLDVTQLQPDSTLKNGCHEYSYTTPWE